MNEIPSRNLPQGWVATKIGEIASVLRGVTYKKENSSLEARNGLVPILRATNIAGGLEFEDLVFVPRTNVSEEQLLRVGDIVLAASSGSRAVVGKAAILLHEWTGSFGAFCYAVRPILLNNAKLIAYFFQTTEYRHQVSELSAGVNINNLRRHHIDSIPFRLPPRGEQDRLVEEIEKQFTRLDAAVAALKRVQANLKRYRAAVLKAACEGRLVPTEAELAHREGRSYEPASVLLERILTERRSRWEAAEVAKFRNQGKHPKNDKWKARYKSPHRLNHSVDLPEGWTTVSLGQLAWSVKDGPHYSPAYTNDGIPFITGGQVRPSGVDFEAAKKISAELHTELARRCKPEYGDILYTKGGTTGIARVNTYKREFNVWVHVAVLKLVPSLEAFYVQHALNSPSCYAQAQRFTHGVGNQDLGLTRMVNIVFGLPPLAEQKRILEEVERILSIVEELEIQASHNLRRADGLRQAILKHAFQGKLVPQDPNDEPADALLERIRGTAILGCASGKQK